MIATREPVKVAILDLYDGHPNQGMRGFEDILKRYREQNHLALSYDIFDVRGKNEVPDSGYDLYISSGGPGSPLESEGSDWEKSYFALIEDLQNFNAQNEHRKKYVFFVCHSFQLMCRHYKLGEVNQRKSTSFGILPIHKTEAGRFDPFFDGLNDPFFAVDSRDWQVVQPDAQRFAEMGASILALEKERPHVDLERCIMAIRFSDEFFGTQFHPEADATGMKIHLLKEDKKQQVIAEHGEEKYEEMLERLEDPDKIMLTQHTVIPHFLDRAIGA
ncbi:MAG: GMP synthase, partial [Mucilaginibacter polytrichastri]|nr:GMP synthase [Mucilaginibacter polytrichastri]